MQPTRFALTKIQPPRPRRGLIARPGLEQRLTASMSGARLVLLCTPAGFGKTALLTRALASRAEALPLAWVSADEDDDLHRVLDCLCMALEPFDLPWRVAPDAIVSGAGPQRDALRRTADAVLNALAGSEAPGLIVLEDAHRIGDPAVFAWCDLLLERLPDHWTVIITSRTDPPLALPRLRALGELAEFRTEDLRFTPDEARALAEAHQPGTSIEPLWERTQGWAAGLRLALNAGGQGTRGAADRHAFDYLVSEVLDALPAELRSFLLRSSVLPELSPRRCAAVTGQANAQALLEDTEARGLFVSVLEGAGANDGETTLALHALFRDCLEDRLARESPGEVPQLLRRAADSEPDTQRRIGYLLRAGEYGLAQAVLEETAPGLIGEGAIDSVLRLLDQFPSAWRQHAAALDFAEGVACWAHWSFARMADAMRRAEKAYRLAGDETAAQRSLAYHAIALCGQGRMEESAQQIGPLLKQAVPDDLLALVRMLQTWHVLDNGAVDTVPATYALCVDALERADRPEVWSRGRTLPPFISLPGMADTLKRFARGARRHVSEQPTSLRAGVLAEQACALLWQGEFPAALHALEAAEEDLRWLGTPLSVAAFTRTTRALWHAWRGEREPALAGAQGLLDDLDDPLSRDRRVVWRGYYQLFQARIALLVGEVGLLRQLQQRVPLQRGTREPALLARQRITLAPHLAWAEKRWADACSGYEQALAHENQLQLFGQHIEVRLRLAHAQLAQGRSAQAVTVLMPLLQTAQGDQECAPLMAGAQVLSDLLRLGAAAPAALHDRLAQWQHRAQSLQSSVPAAVGLPAPSPAGDKLSERELEVLKRIAAGDSNKLIARAFDLSPHTVKRHVANVLDKLGLSSRGQAAAWYREHG
jgi:LuxR family maltose regulon positive regulatory protein